MPNLAPIRRRFTVAVVALALLDAAGIVFLLSPFAPSRADQMQEYDRLRRERDLTEAQVAPLRGMEGKVRRAGKDLALFDQRLPASSSAVADTLGKLAQKNGVQLSQAKYDIKDSDAPGVRLLVINATLTGDYLSVVKFINGLERDKLFTILDSLGLVEQQGGSVQLQMKLETYMLMKDKP